MTLVYGAQNLSQTMMENHYFGKFALQPILGQRDFLSADKTVFMYSLQSLLVYVNLQDKSLFVNSSFQMMKC